MIYRKGWIRWDILFRVSVSTAMKPHLSPSASLVLQMGVLAHSPLTQRMGTERGERDVGTDIAMFDTLACLGNSGTFVTFLRKTPRRTPIALRECVTYFQTFFHLVTKRDPWKRECGGWISFFSLATISSFLDRWRGKPIQIKP